MLNAAHVRCVALSSLALLAFICGCGGRPTPHPNHGKIITYTINEDVVRAVDQTMLSTSDRELFALISGRQLEGLSFNEVPDIIKRANWSRELNPYLTNYDFDLRHAIPKDPFDDGLEHSFSMGFVVCRQCQKISQGYIQSQTF